MDLERQFVDFSNYVPYLGGNENVYSFRLMNLILAIGAHVDSAFKEMFRCPDFSVKYPNILKKVNKGKATITDYRELEKEYCLSKRKIIFKRLPEREVVIPFQKFESLESPAWWTAYNKIKHEFSRNFKRATLKTAKDALSGAFLLNVVHKPAILRLFEYGVAKPKYREVWSKKGGSTYSMRPTVEIIENILKDTIYPPLFVETTMFYFDCELTDY